MIFNLTGTDLQAFTLDGSVVTYMSVGEIFMVQPKWQHAPTCDGHAVVPSCTKDIDLESYLRLFKTKLMPRGLLPGDGIIVPLEVGQCVLNYSSPFPLGVRVLGVGKFENGCVAEFQEFKGEGDE